LVKFGFKMAGLETFPGGWGGWGRGWGRGWVAGSSGNKANSGFKLSLT
jgi:hypothetical protein